MRVRFQAMLIVLMCLLAGTAFANPAPGTGSCGKPYCYWETPMDITNTEAVWNMLIQPMTIVSGSQRERALLYAEPDEASQPVGEVTCHSQGVHVLENTQDGWSLVECHSSSDASSALRIYGDLVKGYIRTERLTQAETKTNYGLVVDKMTQRLYVFSEGGLLTTLRISTGKPMEDRPQNETAAGEFHLVSMVGSYVAGYGVVCEYAIRFNDGDLLHNVPYQVDEDGKHDYWVFERDLGKRASNGCIRVQRRRTPEGINWTWLWNHLFDQQQTRLVIWEDVPGRQLSTPAADTPIYVLPGLSGAYHKSPGCFCLDKEFWPMQQITYGQLEEDAYDQLADCYYCNPPLREGRIEELNRKYAKEE